MFQNRREAGEKLAKKLAEIPFTNPVVIALPRGGVEVAIPIAQKLKAPLDLLFVKKLGAPNEPELAIGAVAESGLLFINRDLAIRLGISEEWLQQIGKEKIQEIARQRDSLKLESVPVEGRDVILIDDGVATGATLYLAIQSLAREYPKSITVGVPVAPAEGGVLEMLKEVSNRLVVLETHTPFFAVSRWYYSFPQLTTGKVKEMLRQTNLFKGQNSI